MPAGSAPRAPPRGRPDPASGRSNWRVSTMSEHRHHTDVIGSLLRPSFLLEARKAYTEGRLTPPEFKRIEGRAVDYAIGLQEGCGLDVITDGEMRRLWFTGTLTEAVEGLEL